MVRDYFDCRLLEIRRAQYGSRGDFFIRYSVVAAIILALILTVAPGLVLAWAAGYALFEAGLAATLTRSWTGTARTRHVMALCFYGLAGASFMALPLYLVAAELSPGPTFAGSAGLLGLLLCTLGRTQRDTGLILVDSVLMVLLAGALIVIFESRMTGWSDRAAVLILALAVAGTYIGSLIAGWRRQQDLKQMQLRHAAAQKARALGQFVGGVAHDFNNQLTAILGHLELIERLDDPGERGAAIASIRAAAGRAAATVQQLLATSGRTRLTPSEVSMQAFLYDLGDLLSETLEPGMSVDILPLTEALTAHVDRDMLETCALQLCLNAQDATGGAGRIRLSVERRLSHPGSLPRPESPPPHVALVVEDNGPGVPPDTLPLLTEPFYTTKPASEGRGLGLSAVAGFARQSGGALILEQGMTGGLRAVLLVPQASENGQAAAARPAGLG